MAVHAAFRPRWGSWRRLVVVLLRHSSGSPDDPARATTHRLRRRLDRDRQPVARIALEHRELTADVQGVGAENADTREAIIGSSESSVGGLD